MMNGKKVESSGDEDKQGNGEMDKGKDWLHSPALGFLSSLSFFPVVYYLFLFIVLRFCEAPTICRNSPNASPRYAASCSKLGTVSGHASSPTPSVSPQLKSVMFRPTVPMSTLKG